MDNLDDSETTAKISDSAYSNSCSNSQSRRSRSSKSTHSGSNSSGSSGYGGKPSATGFSNSLGQSLEKRGGEKDSKKKKKQIKIEPGSDETKDESQCRSPEAPKIEIIKEDIKDVTQAPPSAGAQSEKVLESLDNATTSRVINHAENISCGQSGNVTTHQGYSNDSFSCVISMHDGVVIYTTSSLTLSLGFPKHMWIGRSFIDFVHPRDRNTFAAQITSGLAVPKNVNGMQDKVPPTANAMSTMVCRIRRYRGLSSGFAVKERVVTYTPFLLKLSFKNITDEEGKVTYLVIQATQFVSAFKTPKEILTNGRPFVIRHAANGQLEYIDPESVPYLGYLPQDIEEKDALQFYHPDDLYYLRQVYEAIVKEGIVGRSKPYRMMVRNGDYIKLETEWSSFINPWSRKLEFVIGKHHIVEGPMNPDVFQPPPPEQTKIDEENKTKSKPLRDNIIRIMNETLTKPAEAAKQQMSKRCQDLASFMESLVEEPSKMEEGLDIQDADHSYYERDSVLLGGISPHHDYNDSKSSTETPLSYNQLNYNETLQRYFDSHQLSSYEDYNTVQGVNVLGLNPLTSEPVSMPNLSPVPINLDSGRESGELSFGESAGGLAGYSSPPVTALAEYQHMRLTESLLHKHNSEMEKELVKMHRETRTCNKSEREKVSNENRQKKKEHLARCNTAYQPSAMPTPIEPQVHGVKRSLKMDQDCGAQKHHCPAMRQVRHRHHTSAAPVLPSSTITTTTATSQWPTIPVNSMNTVLLGVGIPQQMSIMTPVTAVPGMFPLYYAHAPATASTANQENKESQVNNMFLQPMVQCVMYGQAVYGPQVMYSAMNPQMSYQLQDNLMAQTLQLSNTINTNTGNNKTSRDQNTNAPKLNTSLKTKLQSSNFWREKKRSELQQASYSKLYLKNSDNRSSCTAPNPDVDTNSYTANSTNSKMRGERLSNCAETVDKMDGESSYSSFYSSFFKTDSGSAEESGDARRNGAKDSNKSNVVSSASNYKGDNNKPPMRRKSQPPWMEQVSVTSELIYKYQVLTKSLDEVLQADKQKICAMEQPSLVNEQLGQLYLDLQLEGVAARLTLEEGLTSSSSSGEESTSMTTKVSRKKREYSKLVMIYEENMPLPQPSSEEESLEPKVVTFS